MKRLAIITAMLISGFAYGQSTSIYQIVTIDDPGGNTHDFE